MTVGAVARSFVDERVVAACGCLALSGVRCDLGFYVFESLASMLLWPLSVWVIFSMVTARAPARIRALTHDLNAAESSFRPERTKNIEKSHGDHTSFRVFPTVW